jgi:hypothetical protein
MPSFLPGDFTMSGSVPRSFYGSADGPGIQTVYVAGAAPDGATGTLPTAPPAGTGTDGSSAKPALLGSVLKTYAANASRQNLLWQNQSSGDLQIVLYQGAAGGADYSVIISTGVGSNTQGDAGSLAQLGVRHTGAIEIRAASAVQHMSREY